MSIYIVSNRKVVDNKFSNLGFEKSNKEFRIAQCSITGKENNLHYKILKACDLDNLKDTVNCITRTANKLCGTTYMFTDLYTQMLNVNKSQSNCLFFIHGFANTFEDNLEHIQELHKVYIEPADSGIDHLVYVSWPSNGYELGNFWHDTKDAEETGIGLGRLFSKLFSFFIEVFERKGYERCSNKIHLAAHSIGNTVLEFMLQTIPQQKIHQLFGETLLLHSDVRFFNSKRIFTSSKLKQLSARTHVYLSQSDEAYGGISTQTSPLIRCKENNEAWDYSFIPEDAVWVDVTKAERDDTEIEKYLDYSAYIKRPAVVNDIKKVLSGADVHNCSTYYNRQKISENAYKLNQ